MNIFFLLLLLTVAAPALVSATHRNDCVDSSDLGNYFINFCEEKCICEETDPGEFAHVCYREREEFTCMGYTRRQRFLDTYKAVTTPGHPQYELMETLITMHGDNFGTIHTNQWFLPWHRYYAMAVEDVLRNEDCRVTLPWWRWTKKSTNWWTGSPFLPTTSWLGTESPGGYPTCVQDGAFDTSLWNPPGGGCVKRYFGAPSATIDSFPTLADVNLVLNNNDETQYFSFSEGLEHTIHDGIHCDIGGAFSGSQRGDMCSGGSPRDPVFFLHHGYIDQLWDKWQRQSLLYLNSYHTHDPNAALPITYGPTPNNVNDHFDLKKSGVIYVEKKSPPIGPGHAVFFSRWCMWLLFLKADTKLSKQKFLDLGDIEDAIFNNPRSAELLDEVPQLPPRVPSFEELKEKNRWRYEANPELEQELDRTLELRIKRKQERVDSIEKPLTREELENLENPASAMLGLDLDSDEFTKILLEAEVCEAGSSYDSAKGKCKKNRKEKNEFVKDLKKTGRIVGNEIFDKKDPDRPPETERPTPAPVEPEPTRAPVEEPGQCDGTCSRIGRCVAREDCNPEELGTNCDSNNSECSSDCVCKTLVKVPPPPPPPVDDVPPPIDDEKIPIAQDQDIEKENQIGTRA